MKIVNGFLPLTIFHKKLILRCNLRYQSVSVNITEQKIIGNLLIFGCESLKITLVGQFGVVIKTCNLGWQRLRTFQNQKRSHCTHQIPCSLFSSVVYRTERIFWIDSMTMTENCLMLYVYVPMDSMTMTENCLMLYVYVPMSTKNFIEKHCKNGKFTLLNCFTFYLVSYTFSVT